MLMNPIETLLASAFAAIRDVSLPVETGAPEGWSFEMEMELAEEAPALPEPDSPEEEAEPREILAEPDPAAAQPLAEPDLAPALPLAAIPAAPVSPEAGGDQPEKEAVAPDGGARPAPPVAKAEDGSPAPTAAPVPRHADPVPLVVLWSGEGALPAPEAVVAEVMAIARPEISSVEGGEVRGAPLPAGQPAPATVIRTAAPLSPVVMPLPPAPVQIPSGAEKTPDLADEWTRLVGQGRLARRQPEAEGPAMPLPVLAIPAPRPSRESGPAMVVEAAAPPAAKPETSIPPTATVPPPTTGAATAVTTEEPTAVEPSLAAEVAVHLPRDRRMEGARVSVSHAPPAMRVEPRHVIRQLSERIAESPRNQIEITLTPEELGKVRLVITQGDSPTVTVHAENRDTLDLLRRNGELLARELRDTGLGGATISFGDRGAGSGPMQQPERLRYGADHPREGEEATGTATTRHRPVLGRQIDIRI